MAIYNIFYKLWKNIKACYTPKNILWQFISFILTYILVISGFDWWYWQATRSPELQAYLFPAVIIGGFMAIVLVIAFLSYGYLSRNLKVLNTGFAITQASLLGVGISSLYKVFTGRPGPFGLNYEGAITDISREFKFGFYRGGAFEGWPSSHTTVAFALASVLIALYPKNAYIKVFAFLYALYIGIGISTNIHWFSDFVAGTVLGIIIGTAVGRSFYKRRKELEAKL